MEFNASNPCKLCGGTIGAGSPEGAHYLCEARAARGAPTPSLGDPCLKCNGTGYDPDRGMKRGQAIYDPNGYQIRAAFPPCPVCKGSRKR